MVRNYVFDDMDQTRLFQEPAGIRGLFFIDIDGVLTDNKVILNVEGEALFSYSTYDGHGIDLLKSAGIYPIFVTSVRNRVHAQRALWLKVPIFFSVSRKGGKGAITTDLTKVAIKMTGNRNLKVAAIGNDTPDLPMLAAADYVYCPSDSHPHILDYVSKAKGTIVNASHPPGTSCFRWAAEHLIHQWES